MGGLGGKGDERSSESGFSDDLFVFVGFVGEAHATGCVVAVGGSPDGIFVCRHSRAGGNLLLNFGNSF